MALYNDRVFCFKNMQELDPLLDTQPIDKNIGAMVDNDERNIICFKELQNYNDRGNFLYIHPITQAYKREHELDALRRTNPGEFSKQMINRANNITRYESYIKNDKYRSEDEMKKWMAIIESNKKILNVMQTLISKPN